MSTILTPNPSSERLIRASKTFTGAANLGAVGVNELFTTTGAVMPDGIWARCTSDLVDAVDGALFRIGVTGTDALFTASNFEGAFNLDTIDAGDGLDQIAAAQDGWAANIGQDILNDTAGSGPWAIFDNIIMTISTQAITGGVIEFYILYRPLSSDGALALGAGMVAI